MNPAATAVSKSSARIQALYSRLVAISSVCESRAYEKCERQNGSDAQKPRAGCASVECDSIKACSNQRHARNGVMKPSVRCDLGFENAFEKS